MALVIGVVLAIATSLSSARIQTINVDLDEGSNHEMLVVYYIFYFYTYWCIYFSIKTYITYYSLVCSAGELALRDTFGCQLNGYTCTTGDGPRCCEGRQHETRNCVPCDETMHKKPKGTKYTTSGNCDFDSIHQVNAGW